MPGASPRSLKRRYSALFSHNRVPPSKFRHISPYAQPLSQRHRGFGGAGTLGGTLRLPFAATVHNRHGALRQEPLPRAFIPGPPLLYPPQATLSSGLHSNISRKKQDVKNTKHLCVSSGFQGTCPLVGLRAGSPCKGCSLVSCISRIAVPPRVRSLNSHSTAFTQTSYQRTYFQRYA